MSRRFQTIVVLLMMALLPVRALAAVTTGFCAFAHHDGAASAAGHDHSPAHSHDGSPCNSCAEHCSGGAFASAAVPPAFAAAPGGERLRLHELSFTPFIPDPLDPPPLGS